MIIPLLLTLLAAQPEPETLGTLPEALRLQADPEGLWVGRVGVGLAPDGLWLSGQALPHWGQAPERGYDPGLLAALETHTLAGRQAAGTQRFVGELFVEVEEQTSFQDLLIVLGTAERAGFSQARVALRGQAAVPEPLSTKVGVRPMGGREVFRLEEGQWVQDVDCSAPGTPTERILTVPGELPAKGWLPLVQAEAGAFRLAPLSVEHCA